MLFDDVMYGSVIHDTLTHYNTFHELSINCIITHLLEKLHVHFFLLLLLAGIRCCCCCCFCPFPPSPTYPLPLSLSHSNDITHLLLTYLRTKASFELQCITIITGDFKVCVCWGAGGGGGFCETNHREALVYLTHWLTHWLTDCPTTRHHVTIDGFCEWKGTSLHLEKMHATKGAQPAHTKTLSSKVQ